MKITDVKVLRANRAVYCKIYTDEGIVGLGESGAWGFLEASAQAILTMGEYLIGQDPLDIEHHWQYLYRFSHFRGAAVMGAISAIDIALYDIAGKYFHVPVYRLLGGKCREAVPVYRYAEQRERESLVRDVKALMADGARYIRIQRGFTPQETRRLAPDGAMQTSHAGCVRCD